MKNSVREQPTFSHLYNQKMFWILKRCWLFPKTFFTSDCSIYILCGDFHEPILFLYVSYVNKIQGLTLSRWDSPIFLCVWTDLPTDCKASKKSKVAFFCSLELTLRHLKGWKTSQSRTFQPQASTQDLSTPDFSTMNFSTRTFQPWIFEPWGWKVHGWKVWSWNVRGWNVLSLA